MPNPDPSRRGSAAGLVITLLLALGLVGMGAWLLLRQKPAPPTSPATPAQPVRPTGPAKQPAPPDAQAPKPIEPALTVPVLPPPGAFQAKDGVVLVDISEYAGYAGLIAANQGLEPNPESLFTKRFGLKVKLVIGEGEQWGKLNAGEFAASATTADVLAVLGRQWKVTVPAQIGFSRGADGILVRQGIGSINALKGKSVVTSQWNEADFLIRYLAQEAGLAVEILPGLDANPQPDRIGLVMAEDGEKSCQIFASELQRPQPRLAGAVGWTPFTDTTVATSGGKARFLVTNRNLLVVADVLVLNQGWANANPTQAQGLVHGLLLGNRLVRDQPDAQLAIIGKAFRWDAEKTKAELARVHLSNLPENQAFFAGTIDAAGSFGGIYQSAVLAYGRGLIPDPADPDRFHDGRWLKAVAETGEFKDQKIAIAPIRSGSTQALEGTALLSKDIRFLFQANDAALDLNQPENRDYFEVIRRFLQVSPGSQVLLRGHVDNSKIEEFRSQGGESYVRKMALSAMDLSKRRAAEVRRHLIEQLRLDANRIETVGRGWEEPLGAVAEANRRVEVQWFTLE